MEKSNKLKMDSRSTTPQSNVTRTNEVHEIINQPESDYDDDEYFNDIEFISQFIFQSFIEPKVKKYWQSSRTNIKNIQMYIFEEYAKTGNIKTDGSIIGNEEEDDIIETIKEILIDQFKIYPTPRERNTEIDWDKFEQIVGYYLCIVDKHIIEKFKEL